MAHPDSPNFAAPRVYRIYDDLDIEIDPFRVSAEWLRDVARYYVMNQPIELREVIGIAAPCLGITRQTAIGPWADRVAATLVDREYITNTPLIAANVPAAPRPRLRVTIRRLPDGQQWSITATYGGDRQTIPLTSQIKPFLPANYRAHLTATSNRYTSEEYLNDALNAGNIPTQIMADAIRACIHARLTQAADITVEQPNDSDIALLEAQPATLMVAGRAWRLVPTGQPTDMRSILATVRRQVRDNAAVEATRIREAANNESRMVIEAAELRAETIREQLNEERAALRVTFPEWLANSGRPIWRFDGHIHAMIRVQCHIEHIQYNVSEWQTTLYWNRANAEHFNGGYELMCSVRIGEQGQYSMEGISCYGEYGAPHIAHRCCMALQGLPTVLDNATKLEKLETILNRGMKVINLNSLLDRSINHWHPCIIAQIPEPVRQMLTGARHYPGTDSAGTRHERMIDFPTGERTWNRAVSVADEALETFAAPARRR